jgi:branched-chain amino acid transport system permease protein
MSGEVVLMTLLGGMGTVLGPVVGAFIVKTLENRIGEFGELLAANTGIEWFKTIGDSVTIVTGLIFVICVLAFRRGIVGELAALLRKQRS